MSFSQPIARACTHGVFVPPCVRPRRARRSHRQAGSNAWLVGAGHVRRPGTACANTCTHVRGRARGANAACEATRRFNAGCLPLDPSATGNTLTRCQHARLRSAHRATQCARVGRAHRTTSQVALVARRNSRLMATSSHLPHTACFSQSAGTVPWCSPIHARTVFSNYGQEAMATTRGKL